jgi:hypothetical protein
VNSSAPSAVIFSLFWRARTTPTQYNNEAEFVSGPRIARKRKKEIAARLLSFVYILRAYTKFGALLVAAARVNNNNNRAAAY